MLVALTIPNRLVLVLTVQLSLGVVHSAESGTAPALPEQQPLVSGRIYHEPANGREDRGAWIGVFRNDPASLGRADGWTFLEGTRFELHMAASTASTLVAIKRDFVPLLISVPAGFSGDLGTWRLQSGATVSGSVSSGDGNAVVGAIVSVVPRKARIEMPPHVAPVWNTGTDGKYSASGFLPGVHDVLVSAPGYVPSMPIKLQMVPDRSNQVDVTLHRGYTISGRVVDESGDFVALADVSANGGSVEQVVRTDAEGRFELAPIPVEVAVTLSAEHPIGSAHRLRVDSATKDVVMMLRRRVAVRGSVYGTNGGSVNQFTIESTTGSAVLSSRTYHDANSFDTRIDRNAQAIWIHAPGFTSWSKSLNPYDSDSSTLDVGNVVLERADRTLRGRVVDRATGTGIAGAYLAQPRSRFTAGSGGPDQAPATTDAAGRFEITGLPSSRSITLVASAPGYARRTVHAPPGDQPLRIALDVGGSLSGVLVTSDGTPVSGTVRLVGLSEARTQTWDLDLVFGLSVNVGDDGRFAFNSLPAKRFRLKGQSDDGLTGERRVSLREGAATDIRLEVLHHGRVFGSISGLEPGQTAYLRVTDLNRSGSHGNGDFPNGPYELYGIRGPGEFTLIASIPGRQITKPFEMVGVDAQVDLAWDAGYRITGRLTLRGRPKGDVEVAARSTAGSLATTSWGRTNGQGHYEIQGVEVGSYVLAAYGQEFQVEVSGDTVYDIELAAHSVSGTVRSAYPLGDVTVRAKSLASDDIYRTQLDAGGRYRFPSMVRGEYQIDVRTPFFYHTSRVVRVDGILQDVDFDLQLADASEVQAFDVSSGARLSNVAIAVTVRGGQLGPFAFDVLLDSQGTVELPGTLAGGNLTLSSPGYQPAVVPAWNGQALLVQFTPHPEGDGN